MKIKKIGELPHEPKEENQESKADEIKDEDLNSESTEPLFDISSSVPIVNKKNKSILIGGIGLFIVAVLLVLYFFVLNNDANNKSRNISQTSNEDELKRKELELKERELKLREQQLNKSIETNSGNTPDQTSAGKTNFEIQASDKIAEWINALGNRNFSKAYYMMSPKKRGDYSRFSSTKSYGGITRTTVFSCNTNSSSGCYAEVIADYESIDPYNKSGRFTQKFFINNCSGNWEITETSNLSLEYY